jgi:nitrogen PTS system EIIA component
MIISDFLTRDDVILDLRIRDKRHLMAEVARRLAISLPAMQPRTIEAALLAREQLGSTGLGNGFALPHARLDGLNHFQGLFVRLSRSIAFHSIDRTNVRLVFILLVPSDETVPHVTALAAISRRLRDPEVAATLLSCRYPEEAFDLLIRA